ncbi:endoglucanase precursor [bacterium BMS3Bbin02]|nr:endoglucanase precursor [bacterium BMS3Bbin02]
MRRTLTLLLVLGVMTTASPPIAGATARLNTATDDSAMAAHANPPVGTSIVTVTGTPVVGATLTGANGTWSGTEPITYTYQWSRCPPVDPNCTNIPVATNLAYTVVPADIGFHMVLEVLATNIAGSTRAFSVETDIVVEAPPFDDTSGNIHSDAIEEIRAAGITLGCNPPENTEFCPNGNVTRAEMAAFLNRLMDLPAPDRDYFTDDTGSIFENDINRVAAAGITKGCNPPANDNFCLEGNVTRGQMAAFMSRMLGLPTADRDYFTDDVGSIFQDDINRFATAGITQGCNPPANDNFCTDSLVRRDEMATFLSRALAILSG